MDIRVGLSWSWACFHHRIVMGTVLIKVDTVRITMNIVRIRMDI